MSSISYQQQNLTTINSLQKYVTELTVYINENNAKYTKNLDTLKKFYQQQISQLQQQNDNLKAIENDQENQISTLKNSEFNLKTNIQSHKKIEQQLKQENQLLTNKISQQRKKIDELYEEMTNTKKEFNIELENKQKKFKQLAEQSYEKSLKIKAVQAQKQNLQKNIVDLQGQVSQRYSLPEKIKDIQIQRAKDLQKIKLLEEWKISNQRKSDYKQAEINQLKKQNQSLRIKNSELSNNLKLKVQEALSQQRKKSQQLHKRLSSTNEKQLFQIKQLQNSIGKINTLNQNLEKKLVEFQQQNSSLQNKVNSSTTQKQNYIREFQKLKIEYEETISNLQNSIPQYQKKIFQLKQQNLQLNQQLEGLRDLLNQMKAMNNLNPLKQQYRRKAELQLIANNQSKKYSINQGKYQDKKPKAGHQFDFESNKVAEYKQEEDLKWDKLLQNIDAIQV